MGEGTRDHHNISARMRTSAGPMGKLRARTIKEQAKLDMDDELEDWRERHGLEFKKRKKAPRTKVRAPKRGSKG